MSSKLLYSHSNLPPNLENFHMISSHLVCLSLPAAISASWIMPGEAKQSKEERGHWSLGVLPGWQDPSTHFTVILTYAGRNGKCQMLGEIQLVPVLSVLLDFHLPSPGHRLLLWKNKQSSQTTHTTNTLIA